MNEPKPKKEGFWSKIFPDNRSFDSTFIGIGVCIIFYITVDRTLQVLIDNGGEVITIFQGVKELVQIVVVGLFMKKANESKEGKE